MMSFASSIISTAKATSSLAHESGSM
ncbi:MAG: hypothetical protein UZ13_00943, partial [Chloroflexi bacterium OLB13]